jgi:hypothetical protein
VSQGEIASHSLGKRESLSQKEIVSVSEADCLLFARRTSLLSPSKAVSVSEGGRLFIREKLPLYFPRERFALSQREATFVSGRSCLSAFHKENSLLATRKLPLSVSKGTSFFK